MKILTMLSRWVLAIRLWLSTSEDSLFALPAPKSKSSGRLTLVPPVAGAARVARTQLKLVVEEPAANDESEPDNLIVLRASRMAFAASARKPRAAPTARDAGGLGARVYSIEVFRRLSQHKLSNKPQLA